MFKLPVSNLVRTIDGAFAARLIAFVIPCALIVGCQGIPSNLTLPIDSTRASPPASTARADVRLVSSTADAERAKPLTRAVKAPEENLLPRVLRASESPAPEPQRSRSRDSLPLSELQQLAMQANPTLRQAAGLVQQARGNWLQAGLYPNPSVEAVQFANNGPFDGLNVLATQPIVTGNKLALNRAVAAHDVRRARWEARAQVQRVLNDVQIRYVSALAAQRQAALAEELLKIAEQGVRISELLREGEAVSEADVLQAELQRNDTLVLLRSSRFRADAAWRQLANVVGRPDLPVYALDGNLEAPVPEFEFDSEYTRLINDHPLLHAARARADAAEAQIERERVQPKPNLNVTAGMGRDFFAPQFMMYTLQFAVTPPAFNRNQGNIAAALAERQAAQREVVRLELALRDALADAFRRFGAARNEVEIYRDAYLPAADKNLSLVLKAYEAGEFDFLRVLLARRQLFYARVNYITALKNLRNSAIEIEGLLLVGGLEPVQNNRTPSNRAGQTTGPGKFAPQAEVD